MTNSAKASIGLMTTTVCLHAVIWLLLLIFKFSRVRRWILIYFRKPSKNPPNGEMLSIAVKRTSGFIPSSTCLSEALCCYALLLYNGLKPQMVIGVEKKPNGYLDAHAWVELAGNVVIGDNGNLHKYEIMKKRKRKA